METKIIYLIVKYVWVEQVPMGGNKEFCSIIGACITQTEGNEITEKLNNKYKGSRYQFELEVVNVVKASDKINIGSLQNE